MTADELKARLEAMMSDTEPKSKPKAAAIMTAVTPIPIDVPPHPNVRIPKDAQIVAVAESPATAEAPVVVLDDGATFSNLHGCKIAFVDPADEEVSQDALDAGISISDLLNVFDAVRTILRVVG